MLRFVMVLALVLGFTAKPLVAEEVITSDTISYCNALAARMVQQRDLPAEARLLLTEGQAMCERGHVAGGLRRVRLAMMMVRAQTTP